MLDKPINIMYKTIYYWFRKDLIKENICLSVAEDLGEGTAKRDKLE